MARPMPLPEFEEGSGAAAAQGGRRPALATLTAVLFLTFLDTTIVSVALADVQSSLHAGVAQLQWVVNGYALTFASLMLGMGIAGRPSGAQARDARRARRVHRRLAVRRACAPPSRHAGGGPGDHGRGRRGQRARHAVDHPPPLPRASAPRPRARRLGGRGRSGAGHGSGARRRARRPGRLAHRVLVQPRRRPARHCWPRSSRCPRASTRSRAAWTSPASCWDRSRWVRRSSP